MRQLLFLTILFLGSSNLAGQSINWVTWEEAEELSQTEPRKIFVDVYTEWCGYCKKLDNTTLSNPAVVNYINNTYYAIKFDAEHKNDINLNGKVYTYVPSGKRGYNELAKEILKGQMSYPTLVFLDEGFDMIQPIKGFQDIKTMKQILSFYGGNYHKNTPWIKFTQNFSNSEFEMHQAIPVKN
jgi:thioredoxin-related protein